MRPGVRYLVRRSGISGCHALVVEPWSQERQDALLAEARVFHDVQEEDGPRTIRHVLQRPSPEDQFDFGCAGRNADNLARAILADLFDERRPGRDTRWSIHGDAFGRRFLLRQFRSFDLDGDELLDWVAAHEEPCPDCGGSGEEPSDPPSDLSRDVVTCSTCRGARRRHVEPEGTGA